MADKADTKPASDAAVKPEGGEQINIKVRDAEGNEVQFKIKRTTQLKKLMDAYCNRMGTQPGSYRFLFDGHRINDEDTPETLDMQELDCVDAMVTQLGGKKSFKDYEADIDGAIDARRVWFLQAESSI